MSIKNPYIKTLDEISRKAKKKRSPDLIIRGVFARFCANVWEFRAKNIFKLDIEQTSLKKYDGDDFLGGPLSMKEVELFTESDQKKKRLEEHIQNWLEGLELFSRTRAQYIIDINDDLETLFSCLTDAKAQYSKDRAIAYIEESKLKQFEPLIKSFNDRKLGYIVSLRACDLITRAVCDFYDVPDDAFRTLTPDLAKYLRGLNTTPLIDGSFYCRFPTQQIKELRMALSTNSFYKLNDYSIITILSMNVKLDPEKIFESLNKKKSSSVEGLSFEQYLEEYSGENGVFAKENLSIIDYLI